MSTDTVTMFLALLALLAELGVVAAVACFVTGRRRALALMVGQTQALALALLVAAVSMAGSLYFSEVAHFTPCRLCWVQRACMYPLVPILALLLWRPAWRALRILAMVMATAGLVTASYHILVERFPSLESATCDPHNPCSLIWVKRFGYLTIPTMAASAFAAILCLLALAHTAPATEPDKERFDAIPVRH